MPQAVQHGANLWTIDGALRSAVFPLGLRMTAIKLTDGSLLVHSPLRPTSENAAQLNALGPVRWVVAPSRAHHLYAGDYSKAYPDAKLYGAPGLAEKRSDLKFDGVLSDDAPAAWTNEIEQHLFRGAPYLNEVLFFHKPTRTLISTDLVFNMKAEANRPIGIQLFALLTGAGSHFGPHRLIRMMIRDHRVAAQSVQRVMQWDFDRIVMSHGEVLETGGREKFAAAFAYL